MTNLGKTPPSSEITPESAAADRRRFLKTSLLFTATAAAVGGGLLRLTHTWRPGRAPDAGGGALDAPLGPFGTGEARTPLADVTSYNNFYEFGTSKDAPSRLASTLRTRPWTVSVGGEVHRPRELDADDLFRRYPLEERVYRMRCVEGWSMVIPWIGFPLASLLRDVEPTSAARYVAFTTLLDPAQMPGQRSRWLDWPYVEGLRLDEALHPLTILAVGLYGRVLPNQNGAPIRLVVPWKYGFKNAKSIVKITLTREQPRTTWISRPPTSTASTPTSIPPSTIPAGARPRSAASARRRPPRTLPFNGYAEQVASLYSGMDLRRDF